MDIDSLRQHLTASRARLIASLQGASESDFNAELAPGVTVVTALAAFARQERVTVEEARRLMGAHPRPAPAAHGEPARRLTPPPVVHDLAGARHETTLLLDVLSGEGSAAGGTTAAAAALLATLVEAEQDVADQISARIGHGPPPA